VTPFPIVLSSPSGGGKTAIKERLLALRQDLGYSVSCTTRAPRDGEQEGVDYYFLSTEEFSQRRDRGEFAEWAVVHGRLYGTLKREVDRVLGSGRHVVMDIDVQGAAQFARAYPQTALIFVLPPSAEVLRQRLLGRNTEDKQSLLVRLQGAREELRAVGLYHYVVVNDDLDRAVDLVSSIIDAEGQRNERVEELDRQVAQLITQLEQEIGNYSTL
jgi:guanylate kinase